MKPMANHGSRRALRTSFNARSDLLWPMTWAFYLLVMSPVFIPSFLQFCDARDIQTDIRGLMAFKAAADPSGVLNSSWNGVTNPCGLVGSRVWLGITCNDRGRVDTVKLPDMQLKGTFPEKTLSRLTELRYLILPNNSFSGSLPHDLSNLTGLLQFWAQKADFSGPFPMLPEKIAMLDLSDNNLTGPIPDLSGLTNLTRLDLSANQFEGIIPNLPPNLQVLNLSDNSLMGTVPQDLAQRFPIAFEGNTGLCGPPTTTPCLPTPQPAVVIGTDPSNTQVYLPSPVGKKLSPLNIALIAVGALSLIVLILGFLKFCYYRVDSAQKISGKKSSKDIGMSTSMGEPESMKLSFLDESHPNYDLEDLLRASAEMLGKGSLGTAYKAAVLDGGNIVAVKRLKDVKDIGKKEFDEHMQMVGRLRHPDLVPMRAYYYAKEEKLVICDFMPNGSLFSLLHGSRGPGRTPLEWPSRLNIAVGVARGLTFLHQECRSVRIPHGNLKSSNVLLGKNFEVQIADFGLVPLMTPAAAAQRMAGYRAPEYNHSKRISHKADVHSFGVLLLELLTGRQPAVSLQGDGIDLPRWVQSVVREEWTGEVFDLELKTYLHGEEGMVSLLQIAMACVTSIPDKRPDMAYVLEMVESIRREFVLETDSLHSHSNSSDEDLSSHEAPFNVASMGTPIAQMEPGERALELQEESEGKFDWQEQGEGKLDVQEPVEREVDLQEQGKRDSRDANRNNKSEDFFDAHP